MHDRLQPRMGPVTGAFHNLFVGVLPNPNSSLFYAISLCCLPEGLLRWRPYFLIRTLLVKPALSAAGRCIGSISQWSPPGEDPEISYSPIRPAISAYCNGLATSISTIPVVPTTISHSPKLTPVRQGKHRITLKDITGEKPAFKHPVSWELFPLNITQKKFLSEFTRNRTQELWNERVSTG